jgi:O-antigen/teichoic acid export membrane protein
MNSIDRSSNHSLQARIYQGLGAQTFTQAVQFFIRFSEVPLLLYFWGPRLYGEWLMLSAIPAYLSMADGGFCTAACRDMTMRAGAGDRKGAVAIFQSTWVLLLSISIAAGCLAFLCITFLPLRSWFGFVAITAQQVQVVFILLAGHVLIGFQGGLINGGFWVAGKYPLGMTLVAMTQFLEFVGLAVAAALGGGPVQAAAGYLGGRTIGTIVLWLGQHRVSTWVKHGFAYASFSELKRLAGPALASLALPLGNALNIQGIRLVVGLALGPAAVAVFVPLRTMSNLALQPRVVIGHLIEPELGRAFGAGDLPLFRRIFAKSCRLSFWGCIVCILLIGTLGSWFLPLWTGGKIAMHWPAYILLLAALPANALWYCSLMVPYATNRHSRIAVYYGLIYGVLALVLAHFIATWLGLAGAALALLIAEALMAAIVIREALEMTGMGPAEWLRSVLRPPVDFAGEIGAELKQWLAAEPKRIAR